ncbi:hypothetical protein SAMD00079811_71750 [Scytonema sp. HK-05]|nr:hypothetical protein SAMD00079811_71750 [Scytonema sp. HK-05]
MELCSKWMGDFIKEYYNKRFSLSFADVCGDEQTERSEAKDPYVCALRSASLRVPPNGGALLTFSVSCQRGEHIRWAMERGYIISG